MIAASLRVTTTFLPVCWHTRKWRLSFWRFTHVLEIHAGWRWRRCSAHIHQKSKMAAVLILIYRLYRLYIKCSVQMDENNIGNRRIFEYTDSWYTEFTALAIVPLYHCQLLKRCIPVNMPLCASTGPVLVRCCRHRPSTGPVLATNGMFTGMHALCHGWVAGQHEQLHLGLI